MSMASKNRARPKLTKLGRPLLHSWRLPTPRGPFVIGRWSDAEPEEMAKRESRERWKIPSFEEVVGRVDRGERA